MKTSYGLGGNFVPLFSETVLGSPYGPGWFHQNEPWHSSDASGLANESGKRTSNKNSPLNISNSFKYKN